MWQTNLIHKVPILKEKVYELYVLQWGTGTGTGNRFLSKLGTVEPVPEKSGYPISLIYDAIYYQYLKNYFLSADIFRFGKRYFEDDEDTDEEAMAYFY